ncbi:MAG: hypothetical protein ACRDGS_08775, partial [Chloroflexota bacterium]
MAPSVFADRRWVVRREAVRVQVAALALSRAPNPHHRRLLMTMLADWGNPAGRFGQFTHPHLAPLIYAGLWGAELPAYPLAAAAVIAGMGQALLYDQDTGRHPASWEALDPEETREIGTFLLYSLPPMAVTALEAPPNTRVAMWETLAACLVRVSTGRHDLPAPLEEATMWAAELPATFAALSAQLAGAAPPIVHACHRLGQAIGMAAEFGPTGGHRWVAGAWARASPYDIPPAAASREQALSALADAGLLEPGRG